MDKHGIITLREKKIIRWGNGYAVYITSEAKRFGWDDKNRIKVYAIRDEEGDVIMIRKITGDKNES